MAIELRLVWSSPTRRAPDLPPSVGSPLLPGVEEAQALVDAWVCTPFECGATAIDDLVARIAAALARHAPALGPVCETPATDVSGPS